MNNGPSETRKAKLRQSFVNCVAQLGSSANIQERIKALDLIAETMRTEGIELTFMEQMHVLEYALRLPTQHDSAHVLGYEIIDQTIRYVGVTQIFDTAVPGARLPHIDIFGKELLLAAKECRSEDLELIKRNAGGFISPAYLLTVQLLLENPVPRQWKDIEGLDFVHGHDTNGSLAEVVVDLDQTLGKERPQNLYTPYRAVQVAQQIPAPVEELSQIFETKAKI